MLINTLQFGDITVEEGHIFTFRQGLPGFEDNQQYVILQSEENEPFSYLQSVENNNLSFVITNPFVFFPNYEFQLSESVQEELEIVEERNLMIYSVVTASSDIEKITINLLAPIVMNVQTKLGKQIILHNLPYKTKHRLVDQISTAQQQTGGEESC